MKYALMKIKKYNYLKLSIQRWTDWKNDVPSTGADLESGANNTTDITQKLVNNHSDMICWVVLVLHY